MVKFVDNEKASVKLEGQKSTVLNYSPQNNTKFERFECKCGRVLSSYRALKIHITYQHYSDP